MAGKVCRKKEVALPLRRATAQPLFPLSRRSDSRDGDCACTRDSRPFCIPTCASGGSPPVGACPSFDEPLAVPKDAAPVGFCSGGFTSTSSLRSGQRGSTEVERRRYPEADHCLASAVAFLSARPERSLPTISLRQAFRLQREASMAVDSTACYCPRTSCHHSRSPILSLVTIPLRTATGAGLYARPCDLSRGFLNYFSARFSLSFSPFRPMRKLNPQVISTGGKFMLDSCAMSEPPALAGGSC